MKLGSSLQLGQLEASRFSSWDHCHSQLVESCAVGLFIFGEQWNPKTWGMPDWLF